MQPVIHPEELRELSWVFCSHRHSDHMDPATLSILATQNPSCQFFVPKAELDSARNAGIPSKQMIGVNAGDSLKLTGQLTVDVLPSAHETLETNERGEHRFLGFILSMAGGTIYHSGDCVPYPGLASALKEMNIDLAILPVNGRDEHRRGNGFAGNFTFDEAANLCRDAGISWMVPCHFGMFEFNTISRRELEEKALNSKIGLQCLVPGTHHWLECRPDRISSASTDGVCA
jgi:L-ascorbate metabolism protein UlaG (beta-lactamase superfamily)